MALSRVNSSADSKGHELVRHGTDAFPIACYENDMAKDVVPWHWHEELEAGVVLEGSLVFAAGKERYILKQGDGFYLNAGILHRCWADHASCRLMSMVFHPRLVGGSLDSVIYQNYVQPLLEDRALECIRLSPEVPWQAEMMAQMTDCWQACVQEPMGFEIKARNLLSEMLLALHHYAPAAKKMPSAKALRDAERIKTMLQFIHDNCGEEIRLEQIAASAAVSESECIRCFRAAIGATPVQYLRHYRVRKAAQLLSGTEEKISSICGLCGFQDISYFTKTFREIMGCAPAEYRRKKREESAPQPV